MANEQNFLTKIDTVVVSGVKRFVAREHMPEFNVGEMTDTFDRLFLDKVEENVADDVIAVHHVNRRCTDGPILNELGRRAEIKLFHFLELIKAQNDGKLGPLDVYDSGNGAHIRGSDGNLWNVMSVYRKDFKCWFIITAPIILDPSDTCSPGDFRLLSYDL